MENGADGALDATLLPQPLYENAWEMGKGAGGWKWQARWVTQWQEGSPSASPRRCAIHRFYKFGPPDQHLLPLDSTALHASLFRCLSHSITTKLPPPPTINPRGRCTTPFSKPSRVSPQPDQSITMPDAATRRAPPPEDLPYQ